MGPFRFVHPAILGMRHKERLKTPPYLAPLVERFDAIIKGEEDPSHDEVRRMLFEPRLAQQFFREYLQKDLRKEADIFYELNASHSIATTQYVMANASRYLKEENRPSIRSSMVFPMTHKEAVQAIQSMDDPLLGDTLAVVQSGMSIHMQSLINLVINVYDFPILEEIVKDLSTDINAKGIWKELIGFAALAKTEQGKGQCPVSFAGTFKRAHDNQAFQSFDPTRPNMVRSCVAQFMIKHLLNTAFTEQADGTLAIAQDKQHDGALLSYIYGKLQKNPAKKPSSCPIDALTAG